MTNAINCEYTAVAHSEYPSYGNRFILSVEERIVDNIWS